MNPSYLGYMSTCLKHSTKSKKYKFPMLRLFLSATGLSMTFWVDQGR